MKDILQKTSQNRYFLLFILVFAYVQSIYTRISVSRQIDIYTFTPEAALVTLLTSAYLFSILYFFIRKWQKKELPDTRLFLKIFGASLLTYLVSLELMSFLLTAVLGKIEQNFNQHTFSLALFSRFLDGIIYGSFFLAYYYYHKNKQYQQKLVSYNQAITESKINQLKTQLNPHFLFNNLNVLDQLIEEDKHKASDFLNEFSEIYRYVLQSSESGLVDIHQEIAFAKQYFKLIEYKYGSAYQLHIEETKNKAYVVPLSLQLLIENAIKHNLGTAENPIIIHITFTENILVENNVNLKSNKNRSSGKALQNLQDQYQLLSQDPIEIKTTKSNFLVSLPLIYKV